MLIACAALVPVAGQGDAPARSGAGAQQGVFALPWEIDFARIQHAMTARSHELEQVRRVLDRRDSAAPAGVWLGVKERLRYAPVSEGSAERFDLEFLGTEAGGLPESDLRRRAAQFESHEGFLFHYHGFCVRDVERAARNYEIALLGIDVRLERPVYRVAVMPVRKDRSHWVLELDVETGYPLSRAQYDRDGQRIAEIRVTRFDPLYRGEDLAPREEPGVLRVQDAGAALALAQLPSSSLPQPDVLPVGYELSSATVRTHLFSGAKTVRFVYSDGVDHLFVVVAGEDRQFLAPGHVIGVFRDAAAGMEQCLFVHRRVQFLVIGNGANGFALPLATALYAQVVR